MTVHPSASRLTVTVRLTPSTLVLDVEDDTPLPEEEADAELLALPAPRLLDCAEVPARDAATLVTIVRPSAVK